jgi:hypothetical protein
LASFIKDCLDYSDLRARKVAIVLDSYKQDPLTNRFLGIGVSPLPYHISSTQYDPITCLYLYEDEVNGVIYIDANTDSLKWMFRGDLSNFPQIQFLVISIGLMDGAENISLLHLVMRAAISILSVLSHENQIRVIEHISLATDWYLTPSDIDNIQKGFQASEDSLGFNIELKKQLVAFKQYHNPGVAPSEQEIESFDTTLIRRTYHSTYNRYTTTSYNKNSNRGFFIDVSNKTGFASLEERKDTELKLINKNSKVYIIV